MQCRGREWGGRTDASMVDLRRIGEGFWMESFLIDPRVVGRVVVDWFCRARRGRVPHRSQH